MFILKFDIRSYWRAGTGKGGGLLHDETCCRDAYGLPILPGRTVKGLLRNAVHRLNQLGYSNGKITVDTLFGTRLDEFGRPADQKEKKIPVHGWIQVSNATLASDLREHLIWLHQVQPGRFRELTDGFFHTVHATAIEEDYGSAKDKSLRTMEVVIPLLLFADIKINPPHGENIKEAENIIDRALPLIRAVGSSRTRGLGRVKVSMRPVGIEEAENEE